MICPSCSERLQDSVKHCVHCGIAITRRSVQMAAVINNCGWIARRSLGGFFAGAIGFLLAIAVNRVTVTLAAEAQSPSFSDLLNFFPGQSVFSSAIAGCFIGTVGGMIERSAYKTFLGGLLGVIGGILGGVSYPIFEDLFRGRLYAYSFSMAAVWAVVGALVGLTSGLLEGTRSKILAGILGGTVGAALGGGIGSQMYGAMLMELGRPEISPWVLTRILELLSGGIVGVHVWFFLGIAEKLYIFQRRQMVETEKKVCDFCHFENALNAWYCAQCGSALQVAAKREQIHVTPFRGLERLTNALQFLSWLAATTGVILSIVIFVSFVLQNFLFALFGSLIVAMAVYMLAILFRALADTIKMGTQVSEKLSRDSAPR